MKNAIISVFIILAMPAAVWAGTYSGGDGQTAPYQISTPADWLELIDTPNDWDSNFVLVNDLDLLGVALIPVAGSTPFTGIFKGKDIIAHGFDPNDIYASASISSDPNADQVHLAPKVSYVPNELIVKFKKAAADIVATGISKGKQLQNLQLSNSLDKLNKKYKSHTAKALFRNFKRNRQQINDLLTKDKALLTKQEKNILRRLKRAPEDVIVPDLDRIYKIELAPGESAVQAVKEYNRNTDVEYAELNYIVRAFLEPDDTYYPVQWALNNEGQPYPIGGGQDASGTIDADIDAPEAWDIYTGSSDIVVAVIDTGVDYTHRDLAGNMWMDPNGLFGFDFVRDDNDPMDDHGHGTHCAGIIAAQTNNTKDIAGICWNARIMAVKFLNANGRGSGSNAVRAINYAVNNGADVLSNSWGGGAYSQSMVDAINYAYSQGVIVVAAAGNSDSSNHLYPAYYDHVISVAATDSDDQKASFSSYGEWVDLAAPGVYILSLRAQNTDMYLGATGYNPGDRFVPEDDPDATMYIASGTSMACPHVSGACRFDAVGKSCHDKRGR